MKYRLFVFSLIMSVQLCVGARSGADTLSSEVRADSVVSAAWVETMLDLRQKAVRNWQANRQAIESQRLNELTLGSWYRFEFRLFGAAGKAAWDSGQQAIHDFHTPIEEAFLETGVIDPGKKYQPML